MTDLTPPPRTDSFLTGRVRVRTGWLGRLVLQVEVATEWRRGFQVDGEPYDVSHAWRDARLEDLPFELTLHRSRT